DPRGADLCGDLGDRLGGLASPASRSHPLTPHGLGSCLGRAGDVNRPQEIVSEGRERGDGGWRTWYPLQVGEARPATADAEVVDEGGVVPLCEEACVSS